MSSRFSGGGREGGRGLAVVPRLDSWREAAAGRPLRSSPPLPSRSTPQPGLNKNSKSPLIAPHCTPLWMQPDIISSGPMSKDGALSYSSSFSSKNLKAPRPETTEDSFLKTDSFESHLFETSDLVDPRFCQLYPKVKRSNKARHGEG